MHRKYSVLNEVHVFPKFFESTNDSMKLSG